MKLTASTAAVLIALISGVVTVVTNCQQQIDRQETEIVRRNTLGANWRAWAVKTPENHKNPVAGRIDPKESNVEDSQTTKGGAR